VLAEYELAMEGAYKERATEFLESHWQADALASLAQFVRSPPTLLGCHSGMLSLVGIRLATAQCSSQRGKLFQRRFRDQDLMLACLACACP
jgi:hypothetical protein